MSFSEIGSSDAGMFTLTVQDSKMLRSCTSGLVFKTKGLTTYCKFLSCNHVRKFANDIRNVSVPKPKEILNGSENLNPKDIVSLPESLNSVLLIKYRRDVVDLSFLDDKRNLQKSTFPLEDAQRLLDVLSVKGRSSKSYNESDDIIESHVRSVDGFEPKDDLSENAVASVQSKDLEWREQVLDRTNLLSYYLKLSKIRLTGLVVLTAIGGYAMAPAPFLIDKLCFVTLGTGLMSCAANTVNQFLEVPFDSQMSRTKNRVLVKGHLSCLHAMTFAACSSSIGLSLLYFGVNPLTATLGVINLVLYTLVYTPMKRYSIVNTWIGSVVGAIPPMMGWSACSGNLELGAWLMAGLLYAWQFPHFNALSWNLRPDYSRAGYRMMAVTDPDLCRRVTLRYSIFITALCLSAPVLDITTWTFAVDSLPLNALLVNYSWRFYQESDSRSSRKLFRFSLVHLPALMILMFISKKYHKSDSTDDSAPKISS